MKKILLVDVDSKIPNLALMKISSYYKSKNYKVDIRKLGFSYYPHNKSEYIDASSDYDKVFVSCIFPNNKDKVIIKHAEVNYGGTGYSLEIDLGDDIKCCKPDYTIYPEHDYSLGFITRGCIRKCEFCYVPKKEGDLTKVNTVNEIRSHDKIMFLDNNFLAYGKHLEILRYLVDNKIKCCFKQGLDIRLLNDDNARLLSKMNYWGDYMFAFDNIKLLNVMNTKKELIKRYFSDWRIKLFIYTHPDMDIHNDILFRVNWCKANKFLPYIMRDITCWVSRDRDFYTDIAAYGNQPHLFKKMGFEEFLDKRHKNTLRKDSTLSIIQRKGE